MDSQLNVKSKGYAAFDNSGTLKPWEFERRPVGDDDILIEIKFAGICHSDIHQMKGDWGPQQYPQVPGHEIAGIVTKVGKNVTDFKVGDRAGVGCMVNSCQECANCTDGHEQYCVKGALFTYGNPTKEEPTGITQGGYSNNIVVNKHFVVHIPENIELSDAAPLLCAGITTYAPIIRADLTKDSKVGVVGIGGLGHMAIKFAVSKGATVYGFTSSPEKADDITAFGATPVVVDSPEALAEYQGKLDYVISTIPVQYNVAQYTALVKPFGYFTQVGMPDDFSLTINALALAAHRVHFNASLIGGMPETQEVVNYCAEKGITPQIQMIDPDEVNEAWGKVLDKEDKYRFVIDMSKL